MPWSELSRPHPRSPRSTPASAASVSILWSLLQLRGTSGATRHGLVTLHLPAALPSTTGSLSIATPSLSSTSQLDDIQHLRFLEHQAVLHHDEHVSSNTRPPRRHRHDGQSQLCRQFRKEGRQAGHEERGQGKHRAEEGCKARSRALRMLQGRNTRIESSGADVVSIGPARHHVRRFRSSRVLLWTKANFSDFRG